MNPVVVAAANSADTKTPANAIKGMVAGPHSWVADARSTPSTR
jgi:hypothetical protein